MPKRKRLKAKKVKKLKSKNYSTYSLYLNNLFNFSSNNSNNSGHPERIKNLLKKHNLKGVNQAKRTPNHPKKWGVVLAKEGGRYKLVRFGDNNMTTAGKPSKNDSDSDKKRRKSFKARHGVGKKKLSKLGALYWSNKKRW